jgi:thioredoxin-like negative regulator of GroEL
MEDAVKSVQSIARISTLAAPRRLRSAAASAVLALFVMLFGAASTLYAQDVKALCDKADELLEQGKVADAKKVLEQAKGQAPTSYDVLWRMARTMVLTGDTQEGNKAEQEKTYYNAKYFADEAIKANPNGAQGFVRRAAANGKIALFKGVLGAKESVNAVREDAQKAISLNSDGAQALAAAHYILGRTHLKLTETPKPVRMPIGLGWGNLNDALTNLKKAVDLRSDFILYQLDYARALAKNEQYADARAALQKIASLKFQDYGDDVRKQDAVKLLQDYQGK